MFYFILFLFFSTQHRHVPNFFSNDFFSLLDYSTKVSALFYNLSLSFLIQHFLLFSQPYTLHLSSLSPSVSPSLTVVMSLSTSSVCLYVLLCATAIFFLNLLSFLLYDATLRISIFLQKFLFLSLPSLHLQLDQYNLQLSFIFILMFNLMRAGYCLSPLSLFSSVFVPYVGVGQSKHSISFLCQVSPYLGVLQHRQTFLFFPSFFTLKFAVNFVALFPFCVCSTANFQRLLPSHSLFLSPPLLL